MKTWRVALNLQNVIVVLTFCFFPTTPAVASHTDIIILCCLLSFHAGMGVYVCVCVCVLVYASARKIRSHETTKRG